MKQLLIQILLLFIFFEAVKGQELHGKVLSDDGPVETKVVFTLNDQTKITKTNKDGIFTFAISDTGTYILKIEDINYSIFIDTFFVSEVKRIPIKDIYLTSKMQFLKEVEISKLIAVTQNNDTTTFNADAFKVNADADVSELISKMPSMEINGQDLKFQGEQVTKVLVDGKPFFGSDPYKSIKTLPKDIVKSIKVYDEKSEQDQFSGFRENGTTKTINIITKSGIENSLFGNLSAGYGKDNSNQDVYSADVNLSKFSGNRRFSLAAKKNNVNSNNFTIQANSGGGIQNINSIGFNYSDKLSKQSDLAFSYSLNNNLNLMETNLNRRYFSTLDSGQVYTERNSNQSENSNHLVDLRLNFFIDTFTSLILQSRLSYLLGKNNYSLNGNTFQGNTQLNSTSSENTANQDNYSFQNTILLRRSFRKKGRTLSLNLATNHQNNKNQNDLIASNFYFSLSKNDSLLQRSIQSQSTPNFNADLNYTEPIGQRGVMKLLYQTNYSNSNSENLVNSFSQSTNSYSVLDTSLSGTLSSLRSLQKFGLSYLYRFEKLLFSVNTNYQYSELKNESYPNSLKTKNQVFNNLLVSTDFQYQFSKKQTFRTDYRAQTQTPTANQLQDIIINNNPLHLTTGNPSLKQFILHQISLKYNSVNTLTSGNFSISTSANTTQNFISVNTIIPAKDTLIGNSILLPAGSSLAYPINLRGAYRINFYTNYGRPIPAIKCNFNIGINASQNINPGMINNIINKQMNQTLNLRGQLSSNINERIDFTLQTLLSIVNNKNSLNPQLSRSYFNKTLSGTVNIILPKNFLINSIFNYQANSGLSIGFNQNYILWNLSVGKKIFKHQRGDIRLSVFDILNNNRNISYFAGSDYEQSSQKTNIQRYFMIILNYKVRHLR